MLSLKGLIVLVIFSLLSGYFTYTFSIKTDQLSDEVELTDRITNNPLDVIVNDLEGKAVALKKWQSDLVVLNFWGTWCPPCRREIPLLVQLHKKYLNKGVKIIGIALDDPAAVKSYLEDNYVPYPVLWGSTNVTQLMKELGNEYGSLPFTVVVDSKGKIMNVHLGEIEEQPFVEILDGLLKIL